MDTPTSSHNDATARVFLVTGLSGSGRTSVLKSLEDFGVEAVDNLPLSLLAPFMETADKKADVAVALDTRTRGFTADGLISAIQDIRTLALSNKGRHQPVLVYLDCDDSVILRRYTETRRRHPMADDGSLSDAIARERDAMSKLRDHADEIIDTTQLNPRDLRALLGNRYAADAPISTMSIVIESFAFRNGLPREADLVYDVRFLRNPHYDPVLKPKTGQDADVGEYIVQDQSFASFYAQLSAMLLLLLPLYRREGKAYLTIAIGCTGGQHRSVFVAEKLARTIERSGWTVSLRHRELDRKTSSGNSGLHKQQT